MIRAYVNDSVWAATVNVAIVRKDAEGEGPRYVAAIQTAGEGYEQRTWLNWVTIEDGAAAPTLTLDHETAVALMQALNAHYSGVDDQALLRKDYTAERGRVDKLIDVVSDIARREAASAQWNRNLFLPGANPSDAEG